MGLTNWSSLPRILASCIFFDGYLLTKTTQSLMISTPLTWLGQACCPKLVLSTLNAPFDYPLLVSPFPSHKLSLIGILTIVDNYQGEESEIVIVSLTRSNTAGDIGFMAAPQRLNVLISRARDALIMIGNAETFRKSRKGKETWVPFLDHLNEGRHLYDGLPVKCERHPQTTTLLQKKEDFETKCPDGGCSLPWYVRFAAVRYRN